MPSNWLVRSIYIEIAAKRFFQPRRLVCATGECHERNQKIPEKCGKLQRARGCCQGCSVPTKVPANGRCLACTRQRAGVVGWGCLANAHDCRWLRHEATTSLGDRQANWSRRARKTRETISALSISLRLGGNCSPRLTGNARAVANN